jgi:hypothetical protein
MHELLTPEKIKGIRFEIWLELLLKRLGYPNVERNVEYHKARYVCRQVDVTYTILDRIPKWAILEAKYCSNCNVHYNLRKGTIEKAAQTIPVIDNLVDEVYERWKFISADVSFLVTNKRFEHRVRFEAEKYGIIVVEGDYLTKLYRKAGGKLATIDDSIATIDLNLFDLDKKIEYLRN